MVISALSDQETLDATHEFIDPLATAVLLSHMLYSPALSSPPRIYATKRTVLGVICHGRMICGWIARSSFRTPTSMDRNGHAMAR